MTVWLEPTPCMSRLLGPSSCTTSSVSPRAWANTGRARQRRCTPSAAVDCRKRRRSISKCEMRDHDAAPGTAQADRRMPIFPGFRASACHRARDLISCLQRAADGRSKCRIDPQDRQHRPKARRPRRRQARRDPRADRAPRALRARPPRQPAAAGRRHGALWLAHRHRRAAKPGAPDAQAARDRERRAPARRREHHASPSRRRSCGPTRSPNGLPPDAVHQGLYLEADPLPSPPIEELAAEGIVLVLDQITDPHNVGAIFRSAAAFAVSAIVTTARHSPEATGVLAKSASGALEQVPLVSVQNLARGLAALKERGFLVVGLDSAGDDDLAALPLRQPLALVLGAEGKGLRQLTKRNLRSRRASRSARRDQEPQRVERRRGLALCRGEPAQELDD